MEIPCNANASQYNVNASLYNANASAALLMRPPAMPMHPDTMLMRPPAMPMHSLHYNTLVTQIRFLFAAAYVDIQSSVVKTY